MGKQNCFLSKCRYLNGVKCLKLAWYQCNAPQEIPRPDAATQAVFNWGHYIGNRAKNYFPGGEENLAQGFNEHLRISREWLTRRIPLFEVAYMSNNNLYARPDILMPVGDDAWNIIEVKCNTEIHEVNVRDIAYQRYVLSAAGLKIDRSILMHPKPGIKVKNDTSVKAVFDFEDITSRAEVYLSDIAENVQKIRAACAENSVPNIACGEQCYQPYKCPLAEKCQL